MKRRAQITLNGFDIDRFAKLRPYLYHLTAAGNLAHIRASRSIAPAVDWMRRAGRIDLLRQRRKDQVTLQVNGQRILLRDQKPLARGNIEFALGYTYEELVESLSSRVSFWPGRVDGPNAYGVRHFERYENEHPVIIRARFCSLIAANQGVQTMFCRYNSGCPRCSNGFKSPRGSDTFVGAGDFTGTESKVVEVTFASEVSLPADAEYGSNPCGPWKALFE